MDPIEIIAMAICFYEGADWDVPDEVSDATKDDYLKTAKTIISALTAAGLAIRPVEPTSAMIRAGNRNIEAQINDPEWPTNPPVASCVYIAMIGAGK